MSYLSSQWLDQEGACDLILANEMGEEVLWVPPGFRKEYEGGKAPSLLLSIVMCGWATQSWDSHLAACQQGKREKQK